MIARSFGDSGMLSTMLFRYAIVIMLPVMS